MDKNKKPYEIDQALLDLNTEDLESMDEQKLKEFKDKFSEAYTDARKKRLETQKEFLKAYYNTRDQCTQLMDKVKSGKLTPKKAISELQGFVADSVKLLAERKN